MTVPLNPYVAGNPVGGSPAFVGRADVLREVLRVLRRPQDNAIVLYGQRRIGKTSILQHLVAQLPNEGPYYPVYFDLHKRTDWSLNRVLRDLARTITLTLNQPDPDLGNDPEIGFRGAWLPDILGNLTDGCSLVLLFDEFDVLADPEGGRAATEFFPYLHSLLMDDPGRLQFVFVIGRNVDDLANIALSLFKGTPYLRVSLLNQDDTAELVRLSDDNGTLRWSDAAAERVWELTNGHPFLTQQLCSHVWERAYGKRPKEVPSVMLEDVDAVIPNALAKSRNALVWLWSGLPPAERVVASALAEAGPRPITQDELEQLLHESGVRVVIKLQNAPQLLQEWDLIEPTDGGYRFRVELLRRWIVENRPLRRVQEDLDRIEPVAEGLYQAASGAYRGGQLDQAVEWLRQAIGLNPNHVGANQLLADILLAQGQPGEARQILERLHEYQPAAARSRLVQALLDLAQAAEGGDEQLALYERVLELEPTQPEASAGRRHIEELRREEKELDDLFDKGVGALERRDWRQARRALAEVVRRRPLFEKGGQPAARLLERAMAEKRMPAWVERLPVWVWVLLGVLVIALAVGGGWALAGLQPKPTSTPTSTITMMATLTTKPTAPTPTPTTVQPTDTPTATLTRTPMTAPTNTPTPIPTPTSTPLPPTPTPTSTPAPTPELSPTSRPPTPRPTDTPASPSTATPASP